MAKEVAIKVSVNGTQQAVKSIGDLETAIQQMREELKGVAIGSDDFKRLSGNIQQAESKLKTLNKSFEGLEPQQKAEAFVKFGEGIAGSFAIATAALTAFGVESEDVQKAQLAVTQALTAAVGFRQIAEAGLQAKIVATTISQSAYNAAATAGNAITKAFYTTIAANPIGAIVTAVAALAAGIYALVTAMEEQISVQDEINNSLNTAREKTIAQETQLKLLNETIQDTTKSEEDRQRALDALAKKLPELNGLTLDEEDAILKVNTAVERNIKLIQQRAKAEVLSQLIIEKTRRLIEQQNSELDDNVGFWEEAWIRLKNNYAPGAAEVELVIAGVNNSLEKQNEIQSEINEITEEYSSLLDELLVIEEEQEEIITDTNKSKQKAIDLDKRRIEIIKELARINSEAAKEEIEARREVISIQSEGIPTSEIVQGLTDELNKLKAAIDQALPEEDKLQNRINEIFAIPTDRIDEFGRVYVDFFPTLSRALIEGSKGFDQIADATLDTLAEKFVAKEITKEAFDAGVSLLNNYRKLNDQIAKEPKIFTDLFDPEEYFSLVRELKVASGVITYDIKKANGEIVTSSAITQKSVSEATADIGGYLTNLVDAYVAAGVAQDAELRKTRANFQTEEEFYNSLTAEQRENVRQLGETQADFTKRLGEEAQTRINNIINLGDAIIGVEADIKNVLEQSQELLFEINQTTGEGRVAVFINESAQILEQTKLEVKERQRLLGLLKPEVESFADFRLRAEAELLKQFPQLEQLSADQRLEILTRYYEQLKEKRGEDATDQKEKSQEFFDGLADGLQQISQVAQTGVQVFQQYLQTQLTLLEAEEERVLDQIVGDSEEAEKKRTEIQEEYEGRRKELTKQSQLAQLQLTRIQAVANVAEAVTKALADGPIIGQILAGISAAIGAVQVGVITTQIGQVRNLARGGLLEGPTHEYGGIPLAGGGVVAEGNEAVLNRRASIDYRGLLNEVSMSTGGAPIVSSSFDDTRLVEAITKQNRTPIKAYVLEQDITRSQSVNKRLQQLSKI